MSRKFGSLIILSFLFISTCSGGLRTPKTETSMFVPMKNGIFPWTDWLHYHNYTEIVSTLFYLNNTFPNIVDLFSVGRSWENKTIYCIRLTNETNTHQKPQLFFVGYHHAREPISAELPLYFAVDAATNYGHNETITRLLNYSEIYIVVALNVDGFEAFKNNEWQRKNTHPFDDDADGLLDEDPPSDTNGNGYIEDLWRIEGENWTFITWEGNDTDHDGQFDFVGGVDLNRNYGYEWNATVDSGSDDPVAEDFRGPEPFSEPETRAIRDLAMQHDFKYAITFHSGAEDILYPWGYTNEPSPDDTLFREISADLSNLTGAIYEQSGAWYTTSGTWDDWLYADRSVFAFTCEIYGNDSAWQYEPGPDNNTWWERGITQAFNPDPENIEPAVQRWLPTFTYLADRAIAEAYDVAVTNVASEQTVVQSGSTIRINVTVENHGSFEETFNVILQANGTSVQVLPATIMNGSSLTMTFNWDTTEYPLGNYTLTAHADPLPGETDTANNNFIDGIVQIAKAPTILILSPQNKTYSSYSIPLSFTLDKPTSWIGYSLEDVANVTVTGNTTMASVSDGHHKIVVYATDTVGLTGTSRVIFFTVDTTPPNITAVNQTPSPDNVYPQDEVQVTVTIHDETSGVKQAIIVYAYTNSSGTWIRFVPMSNIEGDTWNASIPAFPYCTNVTYTIVAEDEVGNIMTTIEAGYEYRYHVVPETFLSTILFLLMVATLFAIIAVKKKNRRQTAK